MYLVLRRVEQVLKGKKIKLARSVVGEFLTVQEMGGFQMFAARMDKEMLDLWDAPCDSPGYTVR
jgi:dihydroxyacetone kinase-like protein